jgi:hypothetical protein
MQKQKPMDDLSTPGFDRKKEVLYRRFLSNAIFGTVGA